MIFAGFAAAAVLTVILCAREVLLVRKHIQAINERGLAASRECAVLTTEDEREAALSRAAYDITVIAGLRPRHLKHPHTEEDTTQ